MCNLQQKITRHKKGKKTYSEKTKQLSKLNSDITEILELPDKKFYVTMTNTLKALMEMLDNMQIREVIAVKSWKIREKDKWKC